MQFMANGYKHGGNSARYREWAGELRARASGMDRHNQDWCLRIADEYERMAQQIADQ